MWKRCVDLWADGTVSLRLVWSIRPVWGQHALGGVVCGGRGFVGDLELGFGVGDLESRKRSLGGGGWNGPHRDGILVNWFRA